MRRRSAFTALALALTAALAALAAAPARAAHPAAAEAAPATASSKVLGALGLPDCACEVDPAEVESYRDRVAGAATTAEARELAAQPSEQARRALGVARRLAPWSGNLRSAHQKLLAYEERVAAAENPAAAAREFEGLVQLASYKGGPAQGVTVGGNSGSCHYDTTEIIAIVLGFLFFIIPGIILLGVFC